MAPDDRDLPVSLDDDLSETITERAVACVTGPGAADAVRAALGQRLHVQVTAPRGASTTGFAHALYTALYLEVHHGPPPAERSATYRRIDAHLARRHPVLLVTDADTLRRAVLQDLLGPWKLGRGPGALIFTGTHRLQSAVAATSRGDNVYLWHQLNDA